MLWGIISLKSCTTVLRHMNQKENIVLKNHMTIWEPLIIYITASKSSLESFGGKSVTLVMTNSSTHSCFVSVSLCRTIEQVLQGWVLKSIVRWAVFFSIDNSFFLDETNLQAAFDKLIFVELAIFVDIKLVEHHLRILLCSVLEKYSADGVNPGFKAKRVALRQHPLRHYIVHQLVLRKSHIIWDKVTLEIPSIS